MFLELAPLQAEDKQVLRNLMELCQYDYSDFDGCEVNEHGLYDYPYIDHYLTEEDRKAFFIKVSGRLAGFVLLRRKAGRTSVAEFFILRKYRLKSIGKKVAARIFELFPGEWHISQLVANIPAQDFWRKVLVEYTQGDYSEEMQPNDESLCFKGPAQKFTVPQTTRIYLVRHAHSTVTADEAGRSLSSEGEKSLPLVNEILAGEFIDAVYSSPYRRAIQTVEGVAGLYGHTVSLHKGFRERQLSSLPIADPKAAREQAWLDTDFALPGGESNRTATERGLNALQDVLTQHRGGRVAIGIHGTIMALIMGGLDPSFDHAFSQTLSTPDIYLLTFHGDQFYSAQRIWSVGKKEALR